MDFTQIIVALIPVLGSIALVFLERSRQTREASSGGGTSQTTSTIAILAAGIALAAAVWSLWQVQSINKRFQFLPAEKYHSLWDTTKGEGSVHTTAVSEHVPKGAKAVILNVIVKTEARNELKQIVKGTGSFICGDENGKFNDAIGHYRNISVTEYSDSWSGGLVICPITSERTFNWSLKQNETSPVVNVVSSHGTLIGWW